VLASLVRELHRRQAVYGVSSFPRPPLDEAPEIEPFTRIALPAGAHLLGAASLPDEGAASLDLLESTRFQGPLGEVGLYRVGEGGEVELCGPDRPLEMGAALARLCELTGGMAFVEGSWERRGFAAPRVSDGVVLAVGSGFSGTPERSAAAVRYLVETFALPACTAALRQAWNEARSAGDAQLFDDSGRVLATIPPSVTDTLPLIRDAVDNGLAVAAVPGTLGDELLAPLVRVGVQATIVVRDATRINASPVYVKAWEKAGGRIEVLDAARVIAVTVNPVSRTGSDADPVDFLRMVADAVSHLPVHDVVQEGNEHARRPVWRFWE